MLKGKRKRELSFNLFCLKERGRLLKFKLLAVKTSTKAENPHPLESLAAVVSYQYNLRTLLKLSSSSFFKKGFLRTQFPYSAPPCLDMNLLGHESYLISKNNHLLFTCIIHYNHFDIYFKRKNIIICSVPVSAVH